MEQIKKLTQIANKIRDTLIEFQKQRWLETHSQLAKYCEQLHEVTLESGRLEKSLARNWLIAAKTCSSRIDRLSNDLSYSIQRMKQFTSRDDQKIPTLRSLVDELKQLQQEFATVELEEDENTICVVTEPITLEGIYLGPFKIQLDLDKLSAMHKDTPYFVIALDPHPAATSEDVTHPHISNEKLCEGDGHTAIKTALEQGRLCDFFTMVKGILNTYNPDSPYINLYDWDGVACYDCGYVMSSEDCYYCCHCERDYCSECSTYCRDCEETICLGCAGQCQSCEEPICSSCARRCADCGKFFCDRCMEDDLCQECEQLLVEAENERQETENKQEKDRNEAKTAEQRIQTTSPSVQPDSVGEAIVLQRQNRQ